MAYTAFVSHRVHEVQSTWYEDAEVKSHDDRIWSRIFEMAGDEDVKVRRRVFHALGDGSPRVLEPQVVAAFESFTNDPDARLKRQARKFLAQYRRTGRVNIL